MPEKEKAPLQKTIQHTAPISRGPSSASPSLLSLKKNKLVQECIRGKCLAYPHTQELFLKKQLSVDQLKSIKDPDVFEAALSHPSVQRQLSKGMLTFEKINTPDFSLASNQTSIKNQLIKFCEDQRYNPRTRDIDGKEVSRFSANFIEELKQGNCNGLTQKFLVSAYLEKKKRESKNEEKDEKKITDDLTQFHHEIDTILNWDGKRSLSRSEQEAFNTFAYQIHTFQNPHYTFLTGQIQLDNFMFLSEKKGLPFERKLAVTLCVTQEQFAEKLQLVRNLPNQMISISIPAHVTGLFENRFYGPNTKIGDKEYKTSRDLARAIYSEMGHTGGPTKPLIISLNIFANPEDPKVTYPSAATLLTGSAAGIEPDRHYGQTALHEAARIGAIESLKFYLKQPGCNINALTKKNYNNTAIEFAASNGQIDAARLLMAQGATLPRDPNHFWSNPAKQSPREQMYSQCIGELIQEKKRNLASKPILDLIRRGLLTRPQASALPPKERTRLEDKSVGSWIHSGLMSVEQARTSTNEQRRVLEITQNIAMSLNIPLSYSADSKEEKKEESTDSMIRRMIKQVFAKADLHINREDFNFRDLGNSYIVALHTALDQQDVDTLSFSEINERLKMSFNTAKQIFAGEAKEVLNSFQKVLVHYNNQKLFSSPKSFSLFSSSPASPEKEFLQLMSVTTQENIPVEEKLKTIRAILSSTVNKFLNKDGKIDPKKIATAPSTYQVFAYMHDALNSSDLTLVTHHLDNIVARRTPGHMKSRSI